MLGYALACVIVLALGFDHVSDDDFARVTIAESFAHRPRLDPSGTSWLPFPFWMLGSSMMLFGRSLLVARVTHVVFSSAAAILPYLALRSVGVTRGRSLFALGFALLSPWSLWLGAATVPESFTASFTAAAAIALGAAPQLEGARGGAPEAAASRRGSGLRMALAASLLAACLSRYEPWPVAATLALLVMLRAVRGAAGRRRIEALVVLALITLGPLGWMAWNAYAHGTFLHFFHRVANYKRALGEGATDTVAAALQYPRLFVARRPDVAAAGASGLLLLRDPTLRRRWLGPLACAFSLVAFLSYGSVHDGAPAHHPERALLPAIFIVAMFGADVLGEALPRLAARSRGPAFLLGVVLAVSWLANARTLLREPPSMSASEDRRPQIQRGLALRSEDAAHAVVTPCAYEHFALIAAFGAPERVDVQGGELPKREVTPACPAVLR